MRMRTEDEDEDDDDDHEDEVEDEDKDDCNNNHDDDCKDADHRGLHELQNSLLYSGNWLAKLLQSSIQANCVTELRGAVILLFPRSTSRVLIC